MYFPCKGYWYSAGPSCTIDLWNIKQYRSVDIVDPIILKRILSDHFDGTRKRIGRLSGKESISSKLDTKNIGLNSSGWLRWARRKWNKRKINISERVRSRNGHGLRRPCSADSSSCQTPKLYLWSEITLWVLITSERASAREREKDSECIVRTEVERHKEIIVFTYQRVISISQQWTTAAFTSAMMLPALKLFNHLSSRPPPTPKKNGQPKIVRASALK